MCVFFVGSIVASTCLFSFFFFQAEDGIRDFHVTGVQTCALPICVLFILAGVIANMSIYFRPTSLFNTLVMLILLVGGLGRSEERRIGKECRSRWSAGH